MHNIFMDALCIVMMYWSLTVAYGMVFHVLPALFKYMVRRDWGAFVLIGAVLILWSFFLCWMVFPWIIAQMFKESFDKENFG